MSEGSIGGLRLSFHNGGELFDYVTYCYSYCSVTSLPIGAPRYLVPSVVTVTVIITSESEKVLVVLSRCSGFVTIIVFKALGK